MTGLKMSGDFECGRGYLILHFISAVVHTVVIWDTAHGKTQEWAVSQIRGDFLLLVLVCIFTINVIVNQCVCVCVCVLLLW